MVLCVKNLNYSFKRNIQVLKNINFKVEPNSVHALIGHNGAGKTTLLRLVSGQLKLKSGEFYYNKKFVNDKTEIAFVPEQGGFYERMTVYENIKFRYMISRQPENEMNLRVNLIIEIFGLEEHKNKKGKQLSSGLKKRLALACAMVHKPKVLLLDEPTNGVDPATHKMLIKIIQKLKANNTHIIICSHELDFINQVADAITIINKGEIVLDKKLSELPKNDLENLYLEYTESKSEELYDYI